MRKSITVSTLLGLVLSLTSFIGVAGVPPKTGNVCTKAGQVFASNVLKFTCTKIGKKLIWEKGISIIVPTPKISPRASLPQAVSTASPSNYSSPSPTPTASQMPSPTPTPTSISSVSFQDLQSHLKQIIYNSWFKSTKQLRINASHLGVVNILVGPKTTEDDSNSLDSLKMVSQLYTDFPQVKNLYIIKFAKEDLAWAQGQYDILHPTNYDNNAARNQCSSPSGCVGASTGINSNGDGVIMLGQGGSYVGQVTIGGKNSAADGEVLAHEYALTVQMFNAPCNGDSRCYGNLPVWLQEGNADWSGATAIFSDNFNNYVAYRGFRLDSQYRNESKYTSNWVVTMLNPNPVFLPNQYNGTYWDKYDSSDIYYIGFMVNEILAAIEGPNSIMNLYKNVGEGMSFTEAFMKEFHLAWSDACPLIAQAISEEIFENIQR